MNEQKIIRLLWDTGHFFSPLCPEGHGMAEGALASLDFNGSVVRDAVRSYQDFMCFSLDPISLEHHNRLSNPDGEIGPATLELFDLPRCGHPDYLAPNAAVGSGSWLAGCHGPDTYHQATYRVDLRRMPRSDADWDKVRLAVVDAYAKIGLDLQLLTDGRSNIRVLWEVLGGSVIGLAQFNNQTCEDSVFCKLNPNYWPNFDQVANLLCHEMGHNCNLGHTRGGVMNPIIINAQFLGWQESDPSYRVLVRYFGGTPIPVVPPIPVPPVPVPPGGGVVLSGTIEVLNDGMSLGRFIMVPRPEV